MWNDSCLSKPRPCWGVRGRVAWGIEMKRGKQQSGFSLIELLIVASIILVIVAIAIPNLLRSRIAANEASAVGSLRTLNSACVTYSSTWGTGFPLALSRLGPGKPATAVAADLVDTLLAAGAKSGYKLIYVSAAPKFGTIGTYTVNANPVAPNVTGARYFFTDQSGVIRYSLGSAATRISSPIS